MGEASGEGDNFLKERFKVQLDELEFLQSAFCQPGEMHVDACQDMEDYVNSRSNEFPTNLSYTINVTVNEHKFEISVELPFEYPETEPEVFIRCSSLNKTDQQKLNRNAGEFVAGLTRGDICIFSIVSWLQDIAASYAGPSQAQVVPETEIVRPIGPVDMSRLWIYSHHIYSTAKRKAIVDLAREYYLTGFCMPGKPGVICIEGPSVNCNAWWAIIKSMNWKKIACRCTETAEGLALWAGTFRKFASFRELAFVAEGTTKANHMDLGVLFQFLEQHGCGNIFKDLFGVDGKHHSKA